MDDEQDTYSVETITVTISKRFVNGEPSHWSAEIVDINGDHLGTSMAPNFYKTFDLVRQLITGDTGEPESIHNPWVDFDGDKGIEMIVRPWSSLKFDD